jgi:hypothetical protein
MLDSTSATGIGEPTNDGPPHFPLIDDITIAGPALQLFGGRAAA